MSRRLSTTGREVWLAAAWEIQAPRRNARFAPEQELDRDLGWQVTTLLPRVELGLGVHF